MEKDTTYRLSYWEGPSTTVEPIRPEDNLICGDAPISDETTHKVRQCFTSTTTRRQKKLITLSDELFWQLVRENRPANNTLRQAVAR